MAHKIRLVARDHAEVPDFILDGLASDDIDFAAKRCRSEAEFTEFCVDADAVWTMGPNSVITEESLSKLNHCQVVLRSGSGLDGLPLEAMKRLGIRAANTPESIAETVAEHAVALLFALVRRIPQHDKAVKSGVWNSEETWAQWHVPGQTLGLIGFGLIARHVVKMLGGFDMTFLVHDPYAADEALRKRGVTPSSLNALLEQSDFVSVHCPLNDETRHLLGRDEFKRMKSNALLINTSRGGVIDEEALVEALRNGWIAGAGLDVTDGEPPELDNPLLKLDNVIVTPHIGAFSDVFERKFWTASVEKLMELKK